MEQSEEWRPVVGLEESHEVSNLGRVRRKRDGYIYKQFVNERTQSSVVVYIKNKKGSQSARSVPRMMAMAFIGMPEGNHQVVYHRDGNRFNNRLDNLYWTENGSNMRTEEVCRKRAERLRSDEVRANMSRIRKAQCATPVWRARMKTLSNKANMVHARKIICMETGVIYPSIKTAAESVGRHPMVVQHSLARAERNTSTCVSRGGEPVFHFRYYNPEEWKPKERIWRPVPVSEVCDKYEVSNLGEVRRTKDRMLLTNSSDSKNRYIFVSLYLGRKTRQYRVSHLVADAFLPRQYGLPFVSHRDGDIRNNCVTNLVRSNGSIACNAPFGKANRLAGCRHARSVLCIETGVIYASMAAAARAVGSTIATVKCSCDKREAGTAAYWKKKHRGKPVHHFRYADQ